MTLSNVSQILFMNKKGQLTLWQKPNLPLVTWLIAAAFTKILPAGQLNNAAAVIAFGAIFTWAWLEIFQGANYFRRGLGVIVLALAIFSRL